MHIIEQRKSVWGDLTKLDQYLSVVQSLISEYGIYIKDTNYINSISKVSPDLASVIQILSKLDMIRNSSIQKIRTAIQQDQWYVIKTSHPDIVSSTLDDVQSIAPQNNVWVQVSKWGKVYKRNFDTDIEKILV